MKLNRSLANTGDRVQAELLTSASEYNSPFKITAWLEKPDGVQLSLPTLEARPDYAFWDSANNARLTLFDQDLSAFGAGDYKIEARAYYSDSNNLFGFAAAGLSVCDTPGAVSGTVYGANGSPLGGNGAELASVRAFDVDDGSTTSSASVDSTGAYSMTLNPGRYLLSAVVVDNAGSHSAKDLTPLRIGCGGITASRSLTATAPVMLSSGLKAGEGPVSGVAGRRPGAAASSQIPNPSAFGSYLIGGTAVSNGAATTVSERFFALLGNANPRVDLTMWSEVQAVLNLALLQQQFDAGTIDVTEVAGALNKRFAITLQFDDRAGLKTLTVSIVDSLHGGNVLYRKSEPMTGATDAGWLTASNRLASDLGTRLYQILDDARDRPVVPRLTMVVTPSEVQPGGSITVTGTLKDADGTPAPAKTVTLAHQKPAGAETLSLTTDQAGAYQTQLAVGDVSGQGTLDASFTGRDRQTSNPRHESYRVVGSPDLALSSTRLRLRKDETAQICAALKSNGVAVAGAVVTMTTRLGWLEHTSVTTGADGRGCDTYTAGGSRSGVENISAVATYVVTSTVASATASLLMTIDGGVGLYLSPARNTVSDGSVTRVDVAIRIGGSGAGAIPVQLSLAGAGSLSTTSVQTNSGGSSTVYYVAPSSGEGSTVVTGVATVEGAGYTQTVTLNYRPAACAVGPEVPQCYDVTILPNDFQALRLKNDGTGTVFGTTTTYAAGVADYYVATWTWQNGAVITGSKMPTLGGTSQISEIRDVNDFGVAVGLVVSDTANYGVKWQAGKAYRLAQGGSGTRATGINNSGDAVGSYGGPYNFWPIIWPGTNQPSSSGVITGTAVYYGLGGWGGGSAEGYFFDINNSGMVAAQFAYTTTSSPGFALWAAATWKDDTVVELGTLGGNGSEPRFVNDSGFVVGDSKLGNEKTHGFLWNGTSLTDLGSLPGSDGYSSAYSVNSSGKVVGYSGNGPFLYQAGKMYDLTRLVDFADSGNLGGSAYSINDSGWILIGDHLLKPR